MLFWNKKTAQKRKSAIKKPQFNRISYGPLGPKAANGYSSATNLSRIDGMTANTMSGDAHLKYDRTTLIAQSRDFYRNNAIYRGLVDRACAYIVGGGFGLLCKSPNEAVNNKIQALWSNWCKNPEVRELWFSTSYEQLLCREWIIAGDLLEYRLNSGKVQVFEAEQVSDGSWSNTGIEINDLGKPTGFYVGKYTDYGQVDPGTVTKLPADQCHFICDPERPTASRGVPTCQAAFSMLHRINDVCDSEALAWQMLSRLALSVTRTGGSGMAYGESADLGENDDSTMVDRMTDIGSAVIFHGEPGEEIKGVDRNIPGQNFSESLRMMLRLLGLPLGLPLEIVLLDWSNTSYSSSRALLEQAYQGFTAKQNLLVSKRYSPCFIWKLKEWQASGLIPKGAEYEAHEWITPSWPWVDQLKEVQAQGMKLDRGFTTHSAVCKGIYSDRDEVVAKREFEIRDAITRAKTLTQETGVAVPWQLFAGLEVPTNTGQSPMPTEAPEKQPDDTPVPEDIDDPEEKSEGENESN